VRNAVLSTRAPRPGGGYSQAVSVDGLLFVSGQVPKDPDTNELVTGGIADQTRRVLENIGAIVEEGGGHLGDIVKVSVFLRHIEDFAEFDQVYRSYFPSSPPARTTVAAVLGAGFDIEADAIAVVRQ